VRSSELLPLAYFTACAALSWLRPLPVARRIHITVMSAVIGAAIVAVAQQPSAVVRDWAPAAVILAGYYVSGRFFVTPSLAVERWLMSWDRRLLGDPSARFAQWPRAVLAYLDIVYMGCFLLVPAGFAILAARGRSDLADHYWTIVMAAEFGAFAPLAVIQTRPPWLVERKPVLADRAVHRAASRMVEHLTIRANTFPSGHVAGSLAVAFALIDTMPVTGVALMLLAASIGVATVVGRYHYVIDGIAGAGLAIVIWAITRAAGL
jgi:membrane-associated phospholipid phosphatase